MDTTRESTTQDFASLRARIAAYRTSGGKRYSAALKKAIVQQLESGISVEALARELDVAPSLIYRWKRKLGRPHKAPAKRSESVEVPRVLAVVEPVPARASSIEDVLRFEVSGFCVAISKL